MKTGYRAILASTFLPLILTACTEEAPLPPPESRPVKTILVGGVSAGDFRQFPGVVDAIQKADLSFRVQGKITEILVREGDTVKQDQVLAKLDPTDYQIILNDRNELLADTHGTPTDTIHRFPEILPGVIDPDLLEQALDEDGSALATERHFLMAHQTAHAPWNLVYLVATEEITTLLLPRLLPYAVILGVMAITVFIALYLMRREFISPALALVHYIREVSRDPTVVPPALPRLWQTWTGVVARAFTRNREANRRLRESEERLQQILNNSSAVVYVRDTEQRFLLINRPFERLLGMSKDEVVGKSLGELRLLGRFGVTVARISRHEVDFVPDPDDEVHWGDALIVVGKPEDLVTFAEFAGHREKSFDQTDLISLALGILTGVLVGSVSLGFGGESFSLGMVGGPMLVALLVGMAGRSHWSLSVEARDGQLNFDAACRVRGDCNHLGSGYRLSEQPSRRLKWLMDADEKLAAGELVSDDDSVFLRLSRSPRDGATIRWRYRISTVRS